MKAHAWAAVLPREAAVDIAVARGNGAGPTIDRQESLPGGVEALSAARQQIDPGAHRIVTAVKGEDVWFHVLSLPTTVPKEVAQMLELQMDTLTPLPLEEVVYGFEPLGTTADATKVLVAIAAKAAVNERVEALEAAGLAPALVSVDTLALFRGAQRAGLLATDARLNALIEVTPTAGHIVLFSDGQPLSIRTVMVSDDPQGLIAELQRTLITAQVEHAREAGTVTFATWHEELRDAVEQLRRVWHGTAEALSNGRVPSPVACLCLEAAAATGPQVNLLPDEWRVKRRSDRYRRSLVLAGIGLAGLYVLALLAFLVAMAVEQSHVRSARARVEALRPAYSAARQLHGTLTAMKLQLDNKYSALEVLREVTRLMPDGVTLNGFAFKKDQNVTLRGQSASAVNANEFISRLEKSEFFASVKTVSVRTERNLTKFEVIGNLRSNPGSTAWR
jgi:Tfp pilus assembly protein PilN